MATFEVKVNVKKSKKSKRATYDHNHCMGKSGKKRIKLRLINHIAGTLSHSKN